MADQINRYSFSTAALYPRTAAESLSLIARAGFLHAELMPQCFADASPSFAHDAARFKIHVASIHYPLAMFAMLYNANPGMIAEAKTFAQGLVALCAALGTEILVIHPHEVQTDTSLKQALEEPMRENILYLVHLCEQKNITVVVENNPKGVGRTPEGLREYIASLGNASIKPMVDTTEACEAGFDPAEFIRKTHPAHVHLSDHRGEKKHIPAGEGYTDWRAVRNALNALQGYEGQEFRGYYTLEPSYRYYLADPENGLAQAYDFVSGLFGAE